AEGEGSADNPYAAAAVANATECYLPAGRLSHDAEEPPADLLSCAKDAAFAAAWAAGHAADPDGTGDEWFAATKAEEAFHCRILRCIVGSPFRLPSVLTPGLLGWNDGVVVKLAQVAYDERNLPEGTLALHRLAVLSDALEEAGCADS